MAETLVITFGTLFAIIIRSVSCLILAIFCVPLQIKEARVKNGLHKLRKELLAYGLTIFIMNAISIWALAQIFADNIAQNPINIYLQIFNGIATLVLAILGYRIYHQQYTEENKDFHQQVQHLEDQKNAMQTQ